MLPRPVFPPPTPQLQQWAEQASKEENNAPLIRTSMKRFLLRRFSAPNIFLPNRNSGPNFFGVF